MLKQKKEPSTRDVIVPLKPVINSALDQFIYPVVVSKLTMYGGASYTAKNMEQVESLFDNIELRNVQVSSLILRKGILYIDCKDRCGFKLHKAIFPEIEYNKELSDEQCAELLRMCRDDIDIIDYVPPKEPVHVEVS